MRSTFILWFLSIVSLVGNHEDKQRVSVPESVEVIISLSDYFGSICVYFIQNSDVNIEDEMYKRDLIWRQKLLSTKLIPTKTVSLLSNLSDVGCHRHQRLLVITDKVFTRDLQVMNSIHMSDHIWLLFLDKDTSIEEFLTGVNIPFDCHFLVGQPENDHTVMITEVYRVKEGLPLHKNYFGNWTESNGLSGPTGTLYERRNNLHGLVLKTGFRKNGHCTPEKFSVCKKSRILGFLFSVWRIMEKELNFKSEFYHSIDGTSGMETENGSWTGLIGMLQKGEIEISNVELTVTPERQLVVDFSVPILETRLYLMIRASDTYLLNWDAFLYPLSFDLWKTVICVIIICSIILAVTSQLAHNYARDRGDELNFPTSVFIIIGAFLYQGHTFSINSASLKIILLTTYLTTVILVASYSASLVSFLSVRNPKLPFTNFRTFLEDGSYKLLTVGNSAQLGFFKDSRISLFRNIYEKLIQPHESDLPDTSLEGLQRLCSEDKTAYFGPSHVLQYMTDNRINCSVLMIPQAFFPTTTALAMRKHSPYRGLFNYMLQSMRRDGILSSQKMLSPKFKFKVTQEELAPSIEFSEFFPILVLLGSGGILACFLLIAEVCIKKEIVSKI